ncbi:radical SAM protein [Candidatus Marsarchaeota archaeon]|nr:radical SAM protein [Candidatus Marsarchaeota archaeon]MCL5405101.1 radical SAM protein [Candidatus Marsarchaeota archaeon]
MAVKKFMSLAATALSSNVSELKKPYKLNFSITYWCQSRCLTCNIWQIRPKGELTIEEIRSFARKNTSFKWIELTGGEPFLRSDIVEIASAFAENSKDLYVLTMPTNSLCGRQMVLDKLRKILDLGIPKVSITVSLDGYKELHDKIRGIPGNYEKAISMFKDLMELKKQYKNLYFVFGYTMSAFNQGQLMKTIEEVRKDIPEVKYKDFHLNLGQISSNYYGNTGANITASREVIAAEIAEFIRRREFEFGAIPQIERVFLNKLLYYTRTGDMPMRSRSLEASLFLDSYGNVYPSIMWDKRIGNIKEHDYSLDALWDSEIAKQTRHEIRQGMEPKQWTACEAYQSITGNLLSFIR